MPRTRLELAQPFDHYHLKVACIPISPPGRLKCARNRTRTYTAVKPLVPETSVYTNFTTWASSVVPPGLEPGLTEPKPAVLPLHNGTIIFDGANIERFLFSNKKNDENSDKIIIFVLHYMR